MSLQTLRVPQAAAPITVSQPWKESLNQSRYFHEIQMTAECSCNAFCSNHKNKNKIHLKVSEETHTHVRSGSRAQVHSKCERLLPNPPPLWIPDLHTPLRLNGIPCAQKPVPILQYTANLLEVTQNLLEVTHIA